MNALLRTSVVALLLSVSCLAQNVKEIADRVDKHYNGLQTLQTDFTEIYAGAGMSRTESGMLWLKRPGRMRWEYRTPREKLFVTDGKTAWFFVPGERQARKMALKNLDDLRTPLAYLLGKTRLEKEFHGLSAAPDVRPSSPGNPVLRGVPKNMTDRVTDVLLEINPDGSFQRIIAHEVDGSTTEFRFANQKENAPISDARFRFVPPAGVETIQSDQLGQ